MGEVKTHYDVLGLNKKASFDDIKKAYRDIAKKNHPDLNRGQKSANEFIELQKSYSVLSDKAKRSEYDITISIFRPFARKSNGENIFINVNVRLEDLYLQTIGGTYTFDRRVVCDKCKGSRLNSKGRPSTCYHCQGKKFISSYIDKKTNKDVRRCLVCPTCSGTGVLVEQDDACEKCNGDGRVLKSSVVPSEMHIAALAIQSYGEEKTLVFSGLGNEGIGGGMNGDLKVKIRASPHPLYYKYDLYNVYREVEVNLYESLANRKVQIDHFGKKLEVTLDENFNFNKLLKIKDKGVSPHDTEKYSGSLFLRILPIMASMPNEEQTELLKQCLNIQEKINYDNKQKN